jgi:hypothetical protein
LNFRHGELKYKIFDWSEISNKWTLELRKQLRKSVNEITIRNENNKRGIFWIDYEKFMNFFSNISFCHTNLDLYEKVMTGTFLSRTNSINMKTYILTVDEPDSIFYIKLYHLNDKISEISDLNLFVFKKGRTNFNYYTQFKSSGQKFLRLNKLEIENGVYSFLPVSKKILEGITCESNFNLEIKSTKSLSKKMNEVIFNQVNYNDIINF